jgi:ABC-type uncharacterized transport system substrate-binding protein
LRKSERHPVNAGLDLFHRIVPNANVIAVLLNPNNANVELEGHQTREAARLLGLQLVLLQPPANAKSMRLLQV